MKWTTEKRWLILLAITALLPTLAHTVSAAAEEKHTPFVSVLLRDWDSPDAAPLKPAPNALTADMLPKIPPNINTKHAYAVLGYDADTDMLEIWNPHGQNFTPKGPDGLDNGYTTKHGIFHIPLKEAYSFFTSFVFEADGASTQPVETAANGPHAS